MFSIDNFLMYLHRKYRNKQNRFFLNLFFVGILEVTDERDPDP
jgi:hypothetical protein